jgi:hypothetical protein
MDKEIAADYPTLNGWSSLVFLLPICIALPFLAYFNPVENVRYWIVGLLSIPTFFLLGFWAWRVSREFRRRYSDAKKAGFGKANKNG